MDTCSTPPQDENPPDPAVNVVRLDRQECLQRLGTTGIGRIIFTESGLPAAQPACYILDGPDVVARIGGRDGTTVLENNVVAFQADDIDPVTGAGWTVTVVGRARRITDPVERAGLGERGLRTWAPTSHDQLVRIEATIVAGHRLPDATTAPLTN